MASTKRKKIDVRDNGSYPLVPPQCIEIIERSEDNLFYNPRSANSFDPESMESLRTKIQLDGLQNPPIVRFITQDKELVQVQLVAGERRLRNVLKLIADNVPVYDSSIPIPKVYKKGDVVFYNRRLGEVQSSAKETVTVKLLEEGKGKQKIPSCMVEATAESLLPTMPAAKFFTHIPCKVYYDLADERCIGLAWSENKDAKPLTIAEEIEQVERLSRKGYKQTEIAAILLGKEHKSNVTWVSQTGNFREHLPKEAFTRLLDGRLTRHGAVKFLSFKAEDRDRLIAETIAVEEIDRKAMEQELEQQRERAEDQADILECNADDAIAAGDKKQEDALRKQAESKRKAAEAVAEKEKRIQSEAGRIKQSHIDKAAANAKISPRRQKMLPKKDIERFRSVLSQLHEEGGTDPVTKNRLPPEVVAIMHRTVEAIMTGDRDPINVIRAHMINQGDWCVPDDDEEDGPSEAALLGDEDEDEDLGLSDDDYDDEGDFEDDEDRPRGRRDDDYDDEGDFDRAAFSRYANSMDD